MTPTGDGTSKGRAARQNAGCESVTCAAGANGHLPGPFAVQIVKLENGM